MNKLRAGILFAAFAIMITAGGKMSTAKAAEMTKMTKEEAMQSEDPEAARANGYVDKDFYGDDSSAETKNSTDQNVVTFSKKSRGSNYSTVLGMDVSKFQGTINWTRAKEAGIQYALIRVGYRCKESGELKEDPNFRNNIQSALNAGIKVGVYIYSQAVNEGEAVEEANFVIDRVYGYNITLPIVIDYEFGNGGTGRLFNAHLSKDAGTATVNAFCQRVTDLGYTGMVYANKTMLNNYLNPNNISDKYRIWLAHYTTATDYDKTYDFWQFTSSENGPYYGCSSPHVDLDWWYDDGTISGKDYGAVFDVTYYEQHNPDVLQAYGPVNSALLQHFINWGMSEGRQAKADFNVQSYKNRYSDLRRAYGNDLKQYYIHYLRWGKREGRVATGYENQVVGVDGITMFRVYNPNSGEHFYTANYAERDNLVSCGWVSEGTGWIAPNTGDPVYRMYNPNAGDHHYTTSAGERDSLVNSGWVYEGIGFYSDTNKTMPMYREYNPNASAGAHNFTTSLGENNSVCSMGWSYEGIAWYAAN